MSRLIFDQEDYYSNEWERQWFADLPEYKKWFEEQDKQMKRPVAPNRYHFNSLEDYKRAMADYQYELMAYKRTMGLVGKDTTKEEPKLEHYSHYSDYAEALNKYMRERNVAIEQPTPLQRLKKAKSKQSAIDRLSGKHAETCIFDDVIEQPPKETEEMKLPPDKKIQASKDLKLLQETFDFLTLHLSTLENSESVMKSEDVDDIFFIAKMKEETKKLLAKYRKLDGIKLPEPTRSTVIVQNPGYAKSPW